MPLEKPLCLILMLLHDSAQFISLPLRKALTCDEPLLTLTDACLSVSENSTVLHEGSLAVFEMSLTIYKLLLFCQEFSTANERNLAPL